MADISKEIQDFRDAVYGEEVRGSMISLAEKVNNESTAAREAAVNMAEMAAEAALNANTAADRADAAVSNAQKTASDIQEAAERGDFSATVDVESVVTVEAGAQASVENVGTEKDARLRFTVPKGRDGTSIGLGEPEISVDAGTGEPYAEVTASGPDDAKVFHFRFHNLKGEPGAEGAIDENATVTFTASAERENIQSGETLAAILGKLEKIVSDMKEVTFSGKYSDLTGTLQNVSDLTNDAGYVTTDTWKANTADSEGYVAATGGKADQVYGTDAEGNPVWKDGVKAEDLENDFVSKSGDEVAGTLKVQTMVIGTAPSEEIGAIWIE